MPSTPALPRPRGALLAAGLLLLAVLCLLLAAPGARARSHRSSSSCASPTAHAHGSRSCVKRSAHRHKGHARHAKPHARHTRKAKKHKSAPQQQPSPETTPAVCEDGSAPTASGGAFSCQDGSEPVCENGSVPAPSSLGKLVCAPDPDTGETFGEECEQDAEGECSAPTPPICEDGSAPVWSKLGYYNCRYGEPTCETGSNPTFSSNGSILYCEAATSTEES